MNGTRPNIILLSIDALRADHVSSYGYARATTPRIDALADSMTTFSSAYSASSHTREAIPALLTGQYPDTCVDDSYHLAAETIASLVPAPDYVCGAFHSNPFVSRAYGFDRDFETFFDDLRLGNHKLLALAQRAFDRLRNRHYAPAAEINEKALSWLDSIDRPFFLWNHYMDPHGPYDPPAEYAQKYFGDATSTKRAQRLYQRAIKQPDSISAAERAEMMDLYDGEISYVDAQIGAFLDALETRGLLEESLVILTADHGDAFGEHGYYGHPRKLDDELLHVPMVLRTPAELETPAMPAGTVETPVSTLDVVPTLLDAAGIDPGDLPGRSLFEIATGAEQAGGRSVFSEARGQTKEDETHLRRFRMQTDDGHSWLERAIESGDITRGPTGDDSLAQPLREFSAERLQMETADRTDADDETTDEVERRLEALGYK